MSAALDRRDVERLTAHVLGRPTTWVLARPAVQLSPDQRRRLAHLIRRRGAGVPMAYLLGQQAFARTRLTVGPGVLVPRPETEHVVEAALKLLPARPVRAADIGTGAGGIAIAISLARPDVEVFAIDRSVRALGYAANNVRRHRLAGRIRLLHGDLLSPLRRRRIIPDLIAANLPYLTTAEARRLAPEPRAALDGGPDGLRVFRRFLDQLERTAWRVPLVLELDPRRWRRLRSIVRGRLPWGVAELRRDLAGRPRLLVITPRRPASA